MTVRTRFAPSPTGYLHVGGVRTALFAWVIAKKNNGKFILRIEDTDKNREVAGSIDHIMKSLSWLGIKWDEGPDTSNYLGPYLQSERLPIYKTWAEKLISKDLAYSDPYTTAQLDEFRQKAITNKKPFLFRDHRPKNPTTWDGSTALRLKSAPKIYTWHDAVMGNMQAGDSAIDDFILIKSDGYPTYNFAHIIDDYLMEITHVIRSQEFISSIPRYLNLYEALGLAPPIIATLPYVMGPDGKKKLSKRDGAKDVLDYQALGYLPEAIINFLATLGWNDGTEQEIFSIDEIINKFELSRVQNSGAVFDEKRLLWMNGSWIRSLDLDDLYQRSDKFWPESANNADEQYKKKVLSLVQERLKYLAEIPQLTNFFFADQKVDPSLINDNKYLSKLEKSELKNILSQARIELEACDFSSVDLTRRLNQLLESLKLKPAVLFSLVRVATTQAPASPALVESLAVIGKELSLKRIDQQLSALS